MKISKIAGIFAVVAFALTAVSANAAFTRSLTIGSTGADVIELQTLLEEKGFLTIPAGVSKGYFGAMTQAALAKFQAANGIAPAAGYFGPITMAKVASMGSTGGDDTSSTGDLKGGDGDFSKYSVLGSPSSEDVYEGDSTKVYGVEFTAKDSDLKLERAEVTLESTSGSIKKPWKVLDTIAIYNGSDKIGEMDASDSDNWDETSNGSDVYTISLKLSGSDAVVKEDAKAKLYVEVTAQDSIDTADLGNWDVSVEADGLRALNADGINVYEGSATTKSFSLSEAEAGDVTITVDDADNKDASVTVDDTNDTNDVFGYLAKVKSKTGDNKVETVTVTMTSPSSESLTDMIDTAYLFIDGEEVGSESASTTIVFDDLSNTIDEGDKIDFEVRFDINDTNDGARFQNADTVKVTGMTVDYVDQNDDDQTVTSTTAGGVLTFSTSSISVETSGTASASQIGADETKGAFSVSFKVTAPQDEDIYIAKAGANAYTYDIINSSTGATTTATSSSVTLAKTSGGSTSGSYYLISAGTTATFKATVNLDNTAGGDRSLRVGLKSVVYKVGSTGAADSSYTSGIDEDYETPDLQLFTVDAQ